MKKHRVLGGLLAAVLCLLVLAASGSPANAADKPRLAIRSVDATENGFVTVTFLWTGESTDLNGLSIRQDGKEQKLVRPADGSAVLRTRKALGLPTSTIWVVDTSSSINRDGVLPALKKSLSTAAAALPEGDKMGIVTFDDTVTVNSTLTASQAQLDTAIKGITAPRDGKRAVNDGLKKAATMLDGLKSQTNIVLVSSGPDTASMRRQDTVGANLAKNGTGVFVLDLKHDGGAELGNLEKLVNRYGGSVREAASAKDIASAASGLQADLDSQWVTQFQTAKNARGSVNLTVSVAGETRELSYIAGSVSIGSATDGVAAPSKSFGPAFLRGNLGLMLALVTVFAALGLGTYALASIATTKDESLTAMLRPYEEGVQAEDGDGGLAQTAILQRAVELTEDIAERQGLLEKVEGLLERADMPLRAAEALFFYLAGVAIVGLAGFFMFGFVNGLLVLAVIAMLPPAIVNFKAGRRRKQFQGLLPDTLHLLSGSLRAGYSLMQGVEAVSEEVEEPMGKELRRVVTEARLGRDVEDALESVAERMESPDFAWAVMAIRIQREVGGNLSELLLTVADTMIQRERLRRDVAALTAEGKMSAIILGLLPIGLGIFMYGANGTYMEPLFTTGFGHLMLGVAVVMVSIGFAWMKKTINIKI